MGGAGPGGTGSAGAGMGGGSRTPPLADEGNGGLDLVEVAQEEGGVPACVAEPDLGVFRRRRGRVVFGWGLL